MQPPGWFEKAKDKLVEAGTHARCQRCDLVAPVGNVYVCSQCGKDVCPMCVDGEASTKYVVIGWCCSSKADETR